MGGGASLSIEAGASNRGEPGGRVWIGVAGFSYPDWEGVVVPPGAGARALDHVAPLVRLLEANVSHYRIPPPSTALSWLRRTAALGTRFAAKLHRSFTHEEAEPPSEDRFAMAAFLEALASDGRLLAALAQFPPWFRRSRRAEARVLALSSAFQPHRLAVEFRDVSWDEPDARALFAERRIAWVTADQPEGPRTIAPSEATTSPLAYVRLHGRNPDWFTPGVGRDRRYDHLYSAAELEPWVGRVRRLRDAAEDVVVVMNNHFAGQAVVNALQMRAALEGVCPAIPRSLVSAYPVLAPLAGGEPPETGGRERQERLFGG